MKADAPKAGGGVKGWNRQRRAATSVRNHRLCQRLPRREQRTRFWTALSYESDGRRIKT